MYLQILHEILCTCEILQSIQNMKLSAYELHIYLEFLLVEIIHY
jgi:hypothetical protein